MNRYLLGMVAVFSLALAAGCSGAAEEAAPATSEDALATQEGTRLANASVDDVVAAAEGMIREHVAVLTAAHPSIRRITSSNRSQFTRHQSTSYMEVDELIEEILKTQASVAPSSLVGRVDALLRPEVERNARGDVAQCKLSPKLGLLNYSACERAEEKNAFKRAKEPTGIDFDQIRAAWRETTSRSTLDNWMVLPIAFENEPSLADIRKAAGIRAAFGQAGFGAIDDFTSASESVATDNRDFAPIARALRGPGIKKRFSFITNGEVSRNWLIVVDEHNQVWGFQSGYSE